MRLAQLSDYSQAQPPEPIFCQLVPAIRPDTFTVQWQLEDATASVPVTIDPVVKAAVSSLTSTPVLASVRQQGSGWRLAQAEATDVWTAADAVNYLPVSGIRGWAAPLLRSLLRFADELPAGPLNDFVRDVLTDPVTRACFTEMAIPKPHGLGSRGDPLVLGVGAMAFAKVIAEMRMLEKGEVQGCQVVALFHGLARVPAVQVGLRKRALSLSTRDAVAGEGMLSVLDRADGSSSSHGKTSPVADLVALAEACNRLPLGPWTEDWLACQQQASP